MKLTPCTYEFVRYEMDGFQIDALVTGHYDMVLLFAEAVKRLQLTGQNYRGWYSAQQSYAQHQLQRTPVRHGPNQ